MTSDDDSFPAIASRVESQYHAHRRREFARYSLPPACHISGVHDRRGVPARAVYWWESPVGNVCGLCEECCAAWRANAVEDPSLTPLRIWLIAA